MRVATSYRYPCQKKSEDGQNVNPSNQGPAVTHDLCPLPCAARENVPAHIGTQILTADTAVDSPFDTRALFGRDGAFADNPLIDGARRHAEEFGQSSLAACQLAGLFECDGVHSGYVALLPPNCQALLYTAAASIAA